MRREDGRPVELGRGAMGVTYKAFDINLRCPVTLKIISRNLLGDESARLHFIREARVAPACVIQTLPPSSTLAEAVRISSTRWSLQKGKRSKTLSSARAV
jgi:serine/threonine protein kinase